MLVIKNETIPCKNYILFYKHLMELNLMELYLKFHFHKYFYYIL